jgi:hypothetical protein
MTLLEFIRRGTSKESVEPAHDRVQELFDQGGTVEQVSTMLITLLAAKEHGVPEDIEEYFQSEE